MMPLIAASGIVFRMIKQRSALFLTSGSAKMPAINEESAVHAVMLSI